MILSDLGGRLLAAIRARRGITTTYIYPDDGFDPTAFEALRKIAITCYADGCEAENEILVHVQDNPWRGADLCRDHAEQWIVAHAGFIRACPCEICASVRRTLGTP